MLSLPLLLHTKLLQLLPLWGKDLSPVLGLILFHFDPKRNQIQCARCGSTTVRYPVSSALINQEDALLKAGEQHCFLLHCLSQHAESCPFWLFVCFYTFLIAGVGNSMGQEKKSVVYFKGGYDSNGHKEMRNPVVWAESVWRAVNRTLNYMH